MQWATTTPTGVPPGRLSGDRVGEEEEGKAEPMEQQPACPADGHAAAEEDVQQAKARTAVKGKMVAAAAAAAATKKASFRYTPVVKYGFLYKRGNVNCNWNKRWFEARSQLLTYYSSRRAKVVKGQISLVDCRVELFYDSEKGNCLSVTLPSREVFLLKPALEVEMEDWLSGLQACVVNRDNKMDFFQRAVVPDRLRNENSRAAVGQRPGMDRSSSSAEAQLARRREEKRKRHSANPKGISALPSRHSRSSTQGNHPMSIPVRARFEAHSPPREEEEEEEKEYVDDNGSRVLLSKSRQAYSKWKDVLPKNFDQMGRLDLLGVMESLAKDYTEQTSEMEELQLKTVELVGSMKVTIEKLLQSNDELTKQLMLKEASSRQLSRNPALAEERSRSKSLFKLLDEQ